MQPGDLTQFAPQGLGLGAPLVMRPWDSLESVFERANYYGLQPPSSHPLQAAPTTEAAGGVLYFDPPDQADFWAMLRLLQVQTHLCEYAAFAAAAADPLHERYLVQLRIMSPTALRLMFHAPMEETHQALLQQPLTVGELLWEFLEQQQAYWGTGFSSQLRGAMGGDGDWAKETLAFGLLIENSYQCIYRLWSRVWLVTK